MSETQSVLQWTRYLMAIATFLGTVEMILLREKTEKIWSWSVLKAEHSVVSRAIWSVFLAPGHYGLMLIFRILASLMLLVNLDSHLAPLIWLLVTQLAIAVRFRGTFNGGSDTMTFQVLLTLVVAEVFLEYPLIVKACLWYLAIQLALSYLIAGVVKLAQPSWRSGEALSDFLKLNGLPKLSLKTAWFLIFFECAFPAALVSWELSLVLTSAALIFHLVNTYALGLNRFFFAWLSAYPALLWCSGAVEFLATCLPT